MTSNQNSSNDAQRSLPAFVHSAGHITPFVFSSPYGEPGRYMWLGHLSWYVVRCSGLESSFNCLPQLRALKLPQGSRKKNVCEVARGSFHRSHKSECRYAPSPQPV